MQQHVTPHVPASLESAVCENNSLVNLPKRDELLFKLVLALPNASRMGLAYERARREEGYVSLALLHALVIQTSSMISSTH